MTASTTSAHPAPMSVDRHSRVVPAASTIVVASTASTTHARKTATNKAPLPMDSRSPVTSRLFGSERNSC